MVYDVIVQKNTHWPSRHKFAITQNAWKRCCWHCYIWADWFFFLPITLLLQWHVRVYKETFSVNIKIAQTMQNIWNSACEQRVWLFEILLSESLLKKWQTSGIIWEISYSNLETRRYGPKSGVSLIIQESWQHW